MTRSCCMSSRIIDWGGAQMLLSRIECEIHEPMDRITTVVSARWTTILLQWAMGRLRSYFCLHRTSSVNLRRRNSGLGAIPESLDARLVLSNVSIVVDFSLDTNGFFNTELKRDVMQAAADAYAVQFVDNLLAISPSGANRWSAGVNHPGTGEGINFPNLVVPENTVIVYAGAREFQTGIAAIGGPGGFSPSENHGSPEFLNAVKHRGQVGQIAEPPTDFGPWGGFVSFNTEITDWFFGLTTAGIGPNDLDFFSVALHEVGHVLGFGTSGSFEALVSQGRYTGPKAIAEYDFGGNPPLSADEAHWENGIADEGQLTVMDPSSVRGTRVSLTDLDLAGFDDLGWTLDRPTTGAKPHVLLSESDAVVSRGGSPVQLDSTALFTNPDELSLNGAQLVVSITSNRSKGDRLDVLTLNGVNLRGRQLTFNGVVIGRSLVKNGGDLRIMFNGAASTQSVQALIRNLVFSTKKKASALDRQASIQVSDIDDQNTSSALKTITLI